ncbi:lasso peptide isopeptide bond-forming cyclase [Peribacillus simplex]|uniref:asparagine synthase (glutamine-hydrolyzing) n=1 Tax=Peribacillus simplex NBRC 15720 = DSM 1321 TaxID=1349754 RepID=A0A223ELJ4_9BACI|nr:lasso peptide isopeptide bond-forming cyclase [Peribacillus simplex]ASS96101.1 asparagine synthetase B [Peribacillus simplex NBRC 15720 = DSM 1321]MEC1397200.1 lasso peptide isopeptide bond-forming cyclase [Peribacillus simplex]
MSAITGIYHLNEEPLNLQQCRKLMTGLQRYPADSIQIWHSDKVFLGCHAQWITPESVGEELPFYDFERQCTITADAIIDNREDLFQMLQIKPMNQKGMTDSELILLSYYKWKEDAPKFLVGDFAFVIWDEKRQKMFGARDFSGSRTLYYHQSNQKFAFCTTIDPLLSLTFIEKKLNEQWLAEYLAISGMIDAVDSLITPYKNIYQIPPSHSMTIEKNKLTLKRYSYLTQGKRLKLKSNEEYIEAFQSVFQEAVTSRLRTYRNVGAQLSGGLDSGAVVGFAVKKLQRENNKLHTYSYIPPEDFEDFTPKYLLADERPFIKSTVNHVGGITDHYCDFKGKDSYSEIDDFLDIMEMPYKFFENSFWLKGMFEKAKENDIGVLLNGDRGNFSISWGFPLEYYSLLLKRLKWVCLYQELDQYRKNVGGSRRRQMQTIARIGFPVIDRVFPEGVPYKIPSLINPCFAEKTSVYEKFKDHGIDQTGWYSNSDMFKERKKHFEDVFQWNAGSTLSSKLSLRYKLWKRDPTNDIRVIRFCLSLPENQYVQNGVDRALVRNATVNYLPDKVRLNQRYRGVQGADWVHRMLPKWGGFIEEIEQLSTDKKALEFLDGHAIKKALVKIKEGARAEFATNPEYKFLMRSLIVHRFLRKFN